MHHLYPAYVKKLIKEHILRRVELAYIVALIDYNAGPKGLAIYPSDEMSRTRIGAEVDALIRVHQQHILHQRLELS